MSIRRPVARGRAAEHPGAKGLAGRLPKWPECSVTLAGRLPGLSDTSVTLAGRLPGLSKTPVTLAGRLPGLSKTPVMVAGGLPESPNTPTMLAGGLPDICGSHITARRAYKHELIARHITPTVTPRKDVVHIFFRRGATFLPHHASRGTCDGCKRYARNQIEWMKSNS